MEPEESPDVGPGFSEQLDVLFSTRLARRVVAVTMGGLLVLGALFWWVLVMPYDSGGSAGITCGATLDVVEGPDGEAMLARYEEGCDAARTQRRNTALAIAAVVVVAAATVTTWPSGRLTGGPDGSSPARDLVEGDDDPSGLSELVRLGVVDADGRTMAEGERPGGDASTPGPATAPAPDVADGPASELVRLGLIDPTEVPAADEATGDAGES